MNPVLALLGAAASGVLASGSPAPDIAACRLQWTDGQLLIRADRPVTVHQTTLRAPERRIIDILGADLADRRGPTRIAVGEGGVQQVRIARHPETRSLRVVLDLDDEAILRTDVAEDGRLLVARLEGTPGSQGAPASRRLPVPQALYGPPVPQALHGPPVPQALHGPPVPQALYGPPVPQALYGPPVPQALYGPPVPQALYGPPVPQARYGPPVPQALYGPPVPQALYGPPVPQALYGPPVPQALYRPPIRVGPSMRSAVATLPVQQVESESAAPLPAGASLAIGRANGLEDIGEAPASRSVPWPAAQQVIDQLRIRRTKAETTVELHARGPLMAWVQQEAQAQRLTIRVPRSSVDCAVPRPRGLVQRVTLRREEDAWALSFDLEGQLHVLDAAPVDDGHGLRIRIRQAPAIDASKPLVLVDPGHGGYDPGAPGPGGHDESQVALGVARLLGEALAEAGLQAVLTRTMDAEVRLADRVALTEKLGPVAFVSLHCNSSDAPEVGGIETYYRHDSGHSLARAIQEKLVDATGGSDRGIRSGRLYVLRGERIPATLVEMGFISSRTEEAKLVDPEYQKIVARAIAAGVKAYLDGKPTAVARPPAPGG